MSAEEGAVAVLKPSPARRVFAAGCMAALTVLLLITALVEPPAFGWQVLLVLFAAGAAWMCNRTWTATANAVELHEDGLYDSSGRLIAPLSEIEAVERGVFAFKPSNGFLIRLRSPGPRAWQPGLWWRLGRKVGVGGTIPGAPARLMADHLAMTLAQQSAKD